MKCKNSSLQLDFVFLDDGVGEQFLAHLFEAGAGLGLVLFRQFDFDELALADFADAANPRLFNACPMAFPCGSRTPFFNVTNTRAFILPASDLSLLLAPIRA